MSKIYLSKNTEALSLTHLPQPCVCVTHAKYKPPICHARTVHLDFETFTASSRDALKGAASLLLVGLNHMITPSNRTEMAWEVVYNNTPELPKFVVNRTPFIGEPWRLWFSFGAVGAKYLDYTYSYISESHYNAFIEGITESNPFSVETALAATSGVIESDYPEWFTRIDVKEIPMSSDVHSDYLQLKDRCFEEETSIKAIFRRLGAFAQQACPQRCMPATSLFDHRELSVTATNLKIDQYLIGHIKEAVALTNAITRLAYYGRV